MPKRRIFIILILAVVAIAGILTYLSNRNRQHVTDRLTLYGNVDIRDVRVAFIISERIRSVLVDEGHRVTAGQLLAELDDHRLRGVFLEGATPAMLWPQYWPMALIGIVTLTFAAWLFRHRLY